jgi:cysteine synthase
MLDLSLNPEVLARTIDYCRDKGISLPTFAMLKDPARMPARIQTTLETIGLWDIHPANLYRVTWKNDPQDSGGLFGGVNHIIIPPELSGCRANIIALTGRWFPTGAHKVGATFGCLIPRLVTGQFDPLTTKAVWPSTGNYCRGGAYLSTLLACKSVAILPEGMSRERFDWLKTMAGDVIATPGCESNVKEIFDKCWELRNSGQDLMIFNQFDELGNPFWHYHVTGSAVEELARQYLQKGQRLAGYVASSGSGGTLGAGYYLKNRFPGARLVVAEALQCPTLLQNGFGDHRLEGIGDKHVPWIHDAKETDVVIAVDDEIPMRLLRLFNEPVGRRALIDAGVPQDLVDQLYLLGISGIGNLLASVKFAKYFELTEDDYVVTIATDSMQLYQSRLGELTAECGTYTGNQAQRDLELLTSLSIDYLQELGYYDRKRIHNLKYFTWIEQQGRDVQELNDQWYRHEQYWNGTFEQLDAVESLIHDFNDRVGIS